MGAVRLSTPASVAVELRDARKGFNRGSIGSRYQGRQNQRMGAARLSTPASVAVELRDARKATAVAAAAVGTPAQPWPSAASLREPYRVSWDLPRWLFKNTVCVELGSIGSPHLGSVPNDSTAAAPMWSIIATPEE